MFLCSCVLKNTYFYCCPICYYLFYIVHFICFDKTQQDLHGPGDDSANPEVVQSSLTVTNGSNREEACDSGNQQAVQSTSGEVSFCF